MSAVQEHRRLASYEDREWQNYRLSKGVTFCHWPSKCQVTSLLSVEVDAVAVCELGAMLATKSTASCPWDS